MLNPKTRVTSSLNNILSWTIFKPIKKSELWYVHKKTKRMCEIKKYWADRMYVYFIVITKSNKKGKEYKKAGIGLGLIKHFP